MKKKPSNMHVDQAAMSAISSAMPANNASAIPSAPAMSADRVRTDEAAHDVASPPPSPDASPDAARVRAVAAAVTAMTAAEAAKAAATESAGALQQHAKGEAAATCLQQVCDNFATRLRQVCNKFATSLQQYFGGLAGSCATRKTISFRQKVDFIPVILVRNGTHLK